MSCFSIKQLSHKELLAQTKNLVSKERHLHTEILDHLDEIDSRQLYLKMGFSTLFDYAVRELGYSTGAAYRRIQTMRLCRRNPEVKERLKTGQLNLTTACQLQTFFDKQSKKEKEEKKMRKKKMKEKNSSQAVISFQGEETSKEPEDMEFPNEALSKDQTKGVSQDSFTKEPRQSFTETRAKELIKRVEGQSSRTTEKLLAEIDPCISIPREQVRFLGGGQVEVKVVIDEACHQKLEHLKSLLSHKSPSLSYGALLALLSEEALKKHDPQRKKVRTPVKSCRVSSTSAPEGLKTSARPCRVSSTSAPEGLKNKNTAKKITRFIPAHVKKFIWKRDGGRCTYKSHETQRRCLSKHFLQIDHIKPFALGGTSEPSNLRLLCASHNQFRVKAESSSCP